MAQFEGLCSSGLYRLTSQPVRFAKDDVIEIVRSDTVPGTVTTVESVVFSPYVYLDDLGNDSRWVGTPTINLKDYGRTLSGDIGFGLAFLMPDQRDAAIEWSLPAVGPCLVSANVNRGPSRAESIPLEMQFSDGRTETVVLEGKSAEFGRGRWQDHRRRARPARSEDPLESRRRAACACVDLLRLTPIHDADLAQSGEKRWDNFIVEWEAATAQRPWLESVKIVPASGRRRRIDAAGAVRRARARPPGATGPQATPRAGCERRQQLSLSSGGRLPHRAGRWLWTDAHDGAASS